MKRRKNKKTALILVLVLLISVGYAALASNLKINGSSKVNAAKWNVYWDNVVPTTGGNTTVTTPARIKAGTNSTEVEYAVTLNEPGDYYEFTVDAVNNGTIDAMIAANGIVNGVYSDSSYTTPATLPDAVSYTVTYADGTAIQDKHLLAKKSGNTATRETYKVRIEYRNDDEIDEDDLDENDQTYYFKFSVNYVQADSNKIVRDSSSSEQYITSNFSFSWQPGVINSDGSVKTTGGIPLNNYFTPMLYLEDATITINENILIKIVYYDENGDFISTSGWLSKEATNWSTGGTEEISITNSYVRLAIADTSLNNSGSYTISAQSLESRFSYSIKKSENMPIINENIISNNTVLLPDVENGTYGKGFTCTGLTYDDSENVFYVGNYGKMLPGDSNTYNTIVKLSPNLSQNLGEIKLYETLPTFNGDIQGVTIDSSNDSIWFASYTAGKIYNITKTGIFIDSISLSNVSGLAYDSRTDTLWVLTYLGSSGSIKNISKTGTVNKTINFADISDADQIYLDKNNNKLFFTAGANYSGLNYIYKVDLQNNKISLYKTLFDSYAIEGISVVNNTLYIANDGYYHSAFDNRNIIQVYDWQ